MQGSVNYVINQLWTDVRIMDLLNSYSCNMIIVEMRRKINQPELRSTITDTQKPLPAQF